VKFEQSLLKGLNYDHLSKFSTDGKHSTARQCSVGNKFAVFGSESSPKDSLLATFWAEQEFETIV